MNDVDFFYPDILMMKRFLSVTVLGFFVLSIAFGAGHHSSVSPVVNKKPSPASLRNIKLKTPQNSRYLPDRVIVKFEPSVHPSKLLNMFGVMSVDAYAQRYGVQSVEPMFPHSKPPKKAGDVDLSKFYLMKFSASRDAFKVAGELSQLPEVQYAEPVFKYRVSGDATLCTPNDSSRSLQWNLNNIFADSAFCISQGDTSVSIAIVDIGVQVNHPDLAANIWHNSGEMGLDSLGRDKRFNGVDDDGDGYVDDWQGWDFGGADYNNPVGDNDPSPTTTYLTHGTHVAGIASAVTNNHIGISGIGYNTKIMAIKTTSDNDYLDVEGGSQGPFVIFGDQGIVFAADHGAKIINCSWGGPGFSQAEQDIINYATQQGSLVVAAAGNDHTGNPNYPAAYDNVISVAAVNYLDHVTAYSNYGTTVDLAAPGGDSPGLAIYSTLYPSTYGLEAGTSMASPLVAGLAGLVAAKFPSYSPLQIGEQVRVTCDNIDGKNPYYVQQIGKGRINAVRALTESWPSVRMVSFVASDSGYGNNDGSIEPNEKFTITTNLINYLQPTSPSALVTLTSSDTNVVILTSQYSLGVLNTLSTTNNYASPFVVQAKSHPAQSDLVKFTILIDDGNYHDFQSFFVLINPTFATHNINNVGVTLTNNGRIGFNDFPNNSQGVGFTYGGLNQLFEGGVLMGYSATNLVDCVRNDNGVQDADFVSSQIYSLRTPGIVSNQDGNTVFSDSGAVAPNTVGVQVGIRSYAFTSPADSNYVILRYDIDNISGADFSNFYAGLFLDWDIQPNYATNQTSFDPLRDLGFAWSPGVSNSVYCGARALNGASGFHGLINNAAIDLSRSGKWSWLSGGIVTIDSIGDIHFAISSGPYTIPNGGTQTVGFALYGGKSLADLQTSADASFNQWNYIKNYSGNPQSPQLIFPVSGQSNLGDTLLLRWSSAVGAVKYRVQVSTDSAFNHLVVDDSLVLTQLSVIFPAADSTYFWRVLSIGNTGLVSYSSVGKFSVGNPLEISIPILQNPVLSQYADFIVTTTVPFLTVPTMTIAVAGGIPDTVSLTQIASQVYKGSFQFQSSGNVDVRVYAKRSNGMDVTGERIFVVGLMKKGESGMLYANDKGASLGIPANGLTENTYFTILKNDPVAAKNAPMNEAYTFGPAQSFSKPLTVTLQYPDHAAPEGKERFLHMYRSTGSAWAPIETWVNTKDHSLIASVTALGTFAVGYDDQFASKFVPTAYVLRPNYPNPFNPQTRIQFDLPEAGTVHLRIFNVLGQQVAQLVNEDRTFGTFEEVWNGKNNNGQSVASGIYFYQLEVVNGSVTKYLNTQKMVLMK